MRANNNINKNMFRILRIFIVLFLVLAANLSYIQIVKSDWYTNNPLNPRIANKENSTLRGDILDRNNVKIAYSKKENQSATRVYPYGALFANSVGYFGKRIGSAGIEQTENSSLSGVNMVLHQLGPLEQLFAADKGNTIRLTLDEKMQKAAWDAMQNKRGAVVILDTNTGAVRAMVSQPSFDPNSVEKDWDSLRTDAQSPLLNRATQGLYPPGSAIKPMMADAALEQGAITTTERVDCGPYYDLGNGQKIYEADNAVYGNINLEEGIIHSSNVMFAGLAVKMGDKGLESAFKRFGFYDDLKTDFAEQKAHLSDFPNLSKGETAQVGIGQADLLISPLRMAMLASAFGNQGKMMKPYIVDEITSPGGAVIQKGMPSVFKEVTTADRANIINSYMENEVLKGTGRNAAVKGVIVAGKTGTAENPLGADHAWFIGTAQLKTEKISFAIILENSGFGGAEAAPIIRNVINTMLKED
ncbi:peptidoglycan D,D-transpeptidase FtsI family protein [Pectinatus cerevisiiphilus]|uniref:Peptidoglycan glycosyltransferase n=1 Tax=Pectinatus cerevisiiphilus TaxID=86956 RepID=A0A4R3K2I3_9FIRM|nr:penicillin-binding transpeptidase domain-containing protein [Pectinatus cerevisiiphilus]TCS76453.1 peptidoglycan glycosyltransferase [Pectinatus cerevisiiphilus]